MPPSIPSKQDFMKKTIILLLLFACLATHAQSIKDKQAVKAIMDRVNKYRLENPWQEFDNNWIRGTYYAGVMACYYATGDKSYLDQCEAFCQSLEWKLPALPPEHKCATWSIRKNTRLNPS
jgi:hypothetical protein